MNLFKKLALSLALAGLMASTSHALPLITGDISFGGAVVLRLGSGGPVSDVANSTWIDFSSTSVFVTAVGGNYVGLVAPGATAAFTDYLFSPGTPAISPLWVTGVASLTGATQTTIIRDLTGLGVLTLKGTGTLNLPGFDPTPGLWTITVSQGTGTFGFGSSAASIPDGGSTVILLGSAILGLLGISRKLRFLA